MSCVQRRTHVHKYSNAHTFLCGFRLASARFRSTWTTCRAAKRRLQDGAIRPHQQPRPAARPAMSPNRRIRLRALRSSRTARKSSTAAAQSRGSPGKMTKPLTLRRAAAVSRRLRPSAILRSIMRTWQPRMLPDRTLLLRSTSAALRQAAPSPPPSPPARRTQRPLQLMATHRHQWYACMLQHNVSLLACCCSKAGTVNGKKRSKSLCTFQLLILLLFFRPRGQPKQHVLAACFVVTNLCHRGRQTQRLTSITAYL